MKFREEKMQDSGQGKWIVTIEDKEYQETLKRATNRLVANLEVPGFRKGKAPQSEINKFLNLNRLNNEIFNLKIKDAHEFAKQSKPTLEPMGQLEPAMGKNSDSLIEIEFLFDLKPEIKIGAYKGLKKLTKNPVVVTEDEINAVLKSYQERFVMEKTRDDNGKIGQNDKVVFDFKGLLNGVPFDGGEAKDYELIVGSNQFVPGFEESMIGLDRGDHTIKVTFPKEYSPELGGKEVVFELSIKDIKERIVPEINEELVKDLNFKNVTNLSELKVKTKEDILKQKTQHNQNQFVNQVIETVVKNSEINIPSSAVKHQIKELKKEFEQEVIKKGLTLKDYKKITKMTDADIEKEIAGDAKMRIATYLVVSEIKKLENFTPTEQQINDKYGDLATQFSIDIETLKKAITVDQIKIELENDLLATFLFENNGGEPTEEVDS